MGVAFDDMGVGYVSANEIGKAIKTFHALEKFNVKADMDVFYALLRVLCKNKNFEKAEELLLLKQNFFPLDIAGFNIILDGLAADGCIPKAKEFYGEMKSKGFRADPELEQLMKGFLLSNKNCWGRGSFATIRSCYLVIVVRNYLEVNGSLLPASVISPYCTYLCYSGLVNEPRDYKCNIFHKHSKAISTGSLTIGFLTTVLSIVFSVVRAGSSTTLLSPPSSPHASSEKPLLPFDKVKEQDMKKEESVLVSYSYSFFYLIFSLASMYSAMLLTGWSSSVGERGKLVDVGWPFVWVRVVTGWGTAALFIWSLVAPILFPDREF
ncbi:hypothetical protein M5K25_027550 [Dendrobium thyrsiflorum]|uniref:Pentatricopeptide repeat-containing protein n=1 Tax=Dendrobium thyrsiflorum TaxID=117978 RepID=A0ABD0TU51_DENTH